VIAFGATTCRLYHHSQCVKNQHSSPKPFVWGVPQGDSDRSRCFHDGGQAGFDAGHRFAGQLRVSRQLSSAYAVTAAGGPMQTPYPAAGQAWCSRTHPGCAAR
jgi:hypothetical protein